MRGQHDDMANALCGLIHVCTPAIFNVTNVAELKDIGVVTQPRVHFGDANADTATDAFMRQQSAGYGRSRMDGGRIKTSFGIGLVR
jgi:hypothetical protein